MAKAGASGSPTVKVAIVVDWLTDSGGAESVFSETLKALPGATLHALVDCMSAAEHERLGIPHARTTWMHRIPGIGRSYRSWLPLMPRALRSLDLSGADVVLAISHAVAKAAPVAPWQPLLCLCLSPMRYAWDLRGQYLTEAGLDSGVRGLVVRALLDRMRDWDRRTAARVDSFASISRNVEDRVRRSYGRESAVIYPPVDTEYFTPGDVGAAAPGGGYYVTASRFVPYKRVDLIVRAFAGDPARRLVVIGDGPDRAKVRAAAGGAANVTFLGHADRPVLRTHLRAARAFVFAAEEDFGIAPVEAQACGTPVIAFGRGGALETVVPLARAGDNVHESGRRPTGVFFAGQDAVSIREAVERFESSEDSLSHEACRANAERFAASRFRRELAEWVATAGKTGPASR